MLGKLICWMFWHTDPVIKMTGYERNESGAYVEWVDVHCGRCGKVFYDSRGQ